METKLVKQNTTRHAGLDRINEIDSTTNILNFDIFAAKPRAVAGKPWISFLSVTNVSNLLVASRTFSEKSIDSFPSSCRSIHS